MPPVHTFTAIPRSGLAAVGQGSREVKAWKAWVQIPPLLLTKSYLSWATYLSLLYLSCFGYPMEMLILMVPTAQSRWEASGVFRIANSWCSIVPAIVNLDPGLFLGDPVDLVDLLAPRSISLLIPVALMVKALPAPGAHRGALKGPLG